MSQDPISRRDWFLGSLGATFGVVLLGCQSSGARSRSAFVPGPVFPGNEPVAVSTPPPAGPAPRPIQSPASMSETGGFVPRAAWNRSPPVISRAQPMNGINRLTVHHSAIPNDSLRSQADVAKMLNGIRHEHMNRRGEPFADIGYHYIIDPAGRVWEGRTTALQGAHVAGNNEHNLGVMLLGNFQNQAPTSAALSSLDSFVAVQMRRYNIPVSRVHTHMEIGKSACPGRNLQRYMDQTRSRGMLARA
ncbi:MAG: N-acetylmuramoyl-L-alanine amidase [Phycisphaeraceae bacterium]|nr:N-acetylmuramoyl-L-alanine amidase [Phycisphaerae bacterium]MBX3392797.1 N-acetylmuramoyl-L-alanine amidase [Phycisphaeraceae bacterium]